jgi:hypothetical protein
MKPLKIRCSSIAKLMTEPKLKSEVLSVGAKSHIRELAAQEILGIDFEVSDKKLEKGSRVEDEAIMLVGRVRGMNLVKNTERRSNDWISGEADILVPALRIGRDVKSCWSAATYPICEDDIEASQRKTYEYQMHGYLWLWDFDEWHIDHCLVNTPEDLIGYEPLTLHVVDHIPEHLRVTTWTVKRDPAVWEQIKVKVEHARAYYAQVVREFDRTHQDPRATPPWTEPTVTTVAPKVEAPKQPAVAAVPAADF